MADLQKHENGEMLTDRLMILGRAKGDGYTGRAWWRVKCIKCGYEKDRRSDRVWSFPCECPGQGRKRENKVGQKYGRLTVKSLHRIDKKGNSHWKCDCDCGNTAIVRGDNLKSEDKHFYSQWSSRLHCGVQSCGCLRLERWREWRLRTKKWEKPVAWVSPAELEKRRIKTPNSIWVK